MKQTKFKMANQNKEENHAHCDEELGYFESYSDPTIRNIVSMRNDLYVTVSSRKFQLAVISLVIIDCLLVIAEVLLDLRILELNSGKTPAKVLHYLSICILSLFMIEIFVKLYVYQLEFFKHKWEVFDAIIVIVSFSLDVAFRNHYEGVNGIGLIIILRLWRVARILNGIVMSVKKQANRRLDMEKDKREKLEYEISKFTELCLAQEHEIKVLRTLLEQNNIELPQTSQLDIVEKPSVLTFEDSKLSFLPQDSKEVAPNQQS